jgi:hypothetical protein
MGIQQNTARKQAADTAAISDRLRPAGGSPGIEIHFYQAQAEDTLHQFKLSLSQGEGNG